MAKFISCKYAEHEAIFEPMNVVKHCNTHNFEFGGRPSIYDYFDGTNFTKEDFFKRKWEIRQVFRDGQCPPTCKNCAYLSEEEWNDDNYIDFVNLTPWVACNAKCIYCPLCLDKNVEKNSKKYDYYSVVKYMMENDFFIPETRFDFGGGEPTMYERFDDILELIFEKGYKGVEIYTNGIIYSETIAKLIHHGKCKVIISIDSGNRELYYKIKRVDKFDKVKETLSKYVAAQSVKQNATRAKYILLPGINDSEECIIEWLDLCKELGIISVILNLDFNWIDNNTELIYKQKDMPRSPENTTLHIYDLIEFTKAEASKRGIVTSLYGEIFTIKSLVEGEVTLNVVDD